MRLKADASCKVINGHNQPNGCPGIFLRQDGANELSGFTLIIIAF